MQKTHNINKEHYTYLEIAQFDADLLHFGVPIIGCAVTFDTTSSAGWQHPACKNKKMPATINTKNNILVLFINKYRRLTQTFLFRDMLLSVEPTTTRGL